MVTDAPVEGGIDAGAAAGATGAGGGGLTWAGCATDCTAALGRPPASTVVTSAPPPRTPAAATLSRVPPAAESTAPTPMQTPRGASGRCRREWLSP